MRAKARTAAPIVFCDQPLPDEAFHDENQLRFPAQARLETPPMFRDAASVSELQIAEKTFKDQTYREFTVATQRPSQWLFPAAIRQTNSNHPVEDRGVLATLGFSGGFLGAPHSQDKWMLAAVIDGHSGWQTSEYVAKNLATFVERHLKKWAGADENSLTAEGVSRSLTDAFLDLDASLLQKIDAAVALGHSGVAKPGATTVCLLMNGSHMIVANVGDSRAVLCRGGEAVSLTACHNAGDPLEATRLRAAHPGESDIIKEKTGSDNVCASSPASEAGAKQRVVHDLPGSWLLRALTSLGIYDFSKPRPNGSACYTKGRLQLTRAFGDFYLKDARYAGDWNACRLLVNTPHSFPYLTARPEVTVLEQDKEKDEFVVLGSDGVWDELTPQEACSIAAEHLPDCEKAVTAIQQAVLARVVWKHRLESADKVKELSPKQRRSIIDDITCIVVDLKNRS